MSRIVLGLGVAHTPLLTTDSSHWIRRAEADYANPRLNLSDGRWVTYPELLAEVGPRYVPDITPQELARKGAACERALDHVAATLARVAPDLVIIVGDDHRELFTESIQPAVSLYTGEVGTTLPRFGQPGQPEWMHIMGRGYLMDAVHELRCAGGYATALVERMIDEDVDVTAITRIDDPHKTGLGHAYGFVVKRLLAGLDVPIVPFLLNTYYPPNVPSAARAHAIGGALGRAIAAGDPDRRVAIVASGGLSHFIVDEALDRRVLAAITAGDAETLKALPRGALNSGSSEILNWVCAAGALSGLGVTWTDYQPLYRTPAGTGVGGGFAIWSERG